MPNLVLLAQIWLFAATPTCLTMAGFAVFSLHFFTTRLAVPLATAIDTTDHHHHLGITLTLAGIVALRCLALVVFLLVSAICIFALAPRSLTGSLATTHVEPGHSRGRYKVFTADVAYKTKNVGPITVRRYLANAYITTTVLACVAYIVLLSLYVLSNLAMADCGGTLLPYFGQLDQLATAAVERDLKLATGFWFVGDVVVAGIGLVSTVLAAYKLDGALDGKVPEHDQKPPAVYATQ